MEKFEDIEQLISELYEVVKDYKPTNYNNLFTSISDTFRHENYHSDILRFFFNFDEAKEELIKWFNEKLKLKIDFEMYKGGEVLREKGHRDITIYSKDKKSCIVIENKSNDANDQDEQVWGYVEALENSEPYEIKVDGVLYINKYVEKEPEHKTWEEKYNKKIKPMLLITKLIGENSIEELMKDVIKNTTDARLSGISMEIIELFRFIVKGNMYKVTDVMYNIVSNCCFREKLVEVSAFLKEFSLYFANKYVTDVQKLAESYDVKSVGLWDNDGRRVIFIEFMKNNVTFKFDIEFYNLCYDISVTDNTKKGKKIKELKKKMDKQQWLFSDIEVDNGITNRYRLPTESAFDKDKLLASVRDVLDAFELKKR